MKRYLNWVPVALLAVTVSAFTSGIIQSLLPARADQSERVPPTSGIYTGPEFSQLLGNSFRSVSTGNKGSVAPANVGSSAVDGLEWIDDSATPWIKKRYVNGGWAVEGALDPTDSTYAGVIGGGVASIASGSTADLGSVPQANVTITGTTTIAGFGSSAPTGIIKIIRFADALTLTYSTALTVPGGFDLTTAANDRAIVTHLGSGNWEVTQYTRANGIPIDISALGKLEFSVIDEVPPLHVRADGRALSRSSFPAYLAKATRAQNGTRTASNATITGITNTSGFGQGMPVEGTGIGSGCSISSVVVNTSITLNSAGCVTSSGTSTVTVFITGYGTGGDSTTVGVRDCRGRALAGRDHNDPGSLANRLTTTYFGVDSGINGIFGGGESQTLTQAQMPSHLHTLGILDPGHTHNSDTRTAYLPGGTAGAGIGSGGVAATVVSGALATTAAVTGIRIASSNGLDTTDSSGSGAAHSIIQPTLIAECTVRIAP